MNYYSDKVRQTPALDDNAISVLSRRFLRGETPEDLFWRVAYHVSSAEKALDEVALDKLTTQFYNLMASTDFMPNSPTLMNAGRPLGQLAACFVVPVEDSMEHIFQGIKDMAMIQKTGGGTGFSFSRLRPAGDTVSSTAGESSGPISFMKAFNACTEVIKQGGTRRGANMAVLRVDHPDIMDFISCKEDLTELTNFNISVAITDEFMKALEENKPFTLRFQGVDYAKIDPWRIWNKLVKGAWQTGEPGIIFIDAINADNPTPAEGEMESTNPCGEQPLLPYEACNLGSINLANMVLKQPSMGTPINMINWAKLGEAVTLATRFLDNIVEVNNYPLEEIANKTRGNRKIGLGVMGWADLLYELRVPYDSSDALLLAEAIMKFIQDKSVEASIALAEEKGVFPNWEKSVWGQANIPMRNAVTTTIAPTGTISLIAGTSSGIEPLFGLYFEKKLVDSDKILPIINGHLWDYITADGRFTEEEANQILEYVKTHGSLAGSDWPAELVEVFKISSDIAPSDHIRMQAAFQAFTHNAVSKTINFDNDVTEDDVAEAMLLAYALGCKGTTVYRDGSRNSQPLTKGKKKEEVEQEIEVVQEALSSEEPHCIECALPDEIAIPSNGVVVKSRPEELTGKTKQVATGCGTLFVTVNEKEDQIYETFLKAGATGGCAAFTEGTARLISVALRYGVPVGVIVDQLRSVRCDNFRHQTGKNPDLKGKSCPDVVGKVMQEYYDEMHSKDTLKKAILGSKEKIMAAVVDSLADSSDNIKIQVDVEDKEESPKCPDCGAPLAFSEGCVVCNVCGYSQC